MASTSWDRGKKKKNVDISRFVEHRAWKRAEMSFSRKHLRMLEEGLHSDITLMASGGSVNAHRSMLAAVSPVFDAMFQECKDEHFSFILDISNIRIETLQLLLIFFYADENSAMSEFDTAVDENFVELFEACNQYLVSSVLKSVLNRALPRNLTPDNCWYYYYRYTSLQKKLQLDMPYNKSPAAACTKYILNNFDKIIMSESIIPIMQHNPETVRIFMVLYRAKAANSARRRGRPKDDWWNYVVINLSGN